MLPLLTFHIKKIGTEFVITATRCLKNVFTSNLPSKPSVRD
jgi:hypothetical protein